MSVQINCDRCRKNTLGRFLRVQIEVTRGVYGATSSTISNEFLPWKIDWHLCDSCYRDIKRHVSEAPPEAS